MRTRILASILCICIVLLAFAGCGVKLSNSGEASPSSSAAGDNSPAGSDNSGNASAVTSIVTGLVSDIIGQSISLDLVGTPANTEGATSTVSVGTTVYAITGESMTISLADDAVIILANHGYATGDLIDILAGDLLAVAFDGSVALAVIDNGQGTIDDSGTAPDTTDSEIGPDTSGVQDSTDEATYTVNTDNLNVRSQPDTSAAVLGKLAKGTKVTGTVSAGWLKFTYKDQTAYCSADFLTLASSDSGNTTDGNTTTSGDNNTTAGVTDSSNSGVYIVTTDGLNIREHPSTSSTVLGKLALGSFVSGTVKNGWLEFKYNNEIGYCSAEYLTAASTSSGSGTGGVPDSSTAATYVVVTDNLNVRSGPSTTDTTILGTLPKGTNVKGTVTNGWLKFTFNGRTAYLKATYLTEA